jgi:hypothetical protein
VGPEISTAKRPIPDDSIVRASRRATVSAFLTHPATMAASIVSGSDDLHPTGWLRKAGRSSHEDLSTVSKNPWIASRIHVSQRSDMSADPSVGSAGGSRPKAQVDEKRRTAMAGKVVDAKLEPCVKSTIFTKSCSARVSGRHPDAFSNEIEAAGVTLFDTSTHDGSRTY